MDGGADERGYVVATDVGGTCTDTVVLAGEDFFEFGKSLSTPPDFADGVLDSIRIAAGRMGIALEELLGRTSLFMHGSTVVDNTLLTRNGAATGLVTTAGFEDTLLVTRGAYGRWSGQTEDRIKHPVATDRPAPLVEPARILGLRERVDYKGEVLLKLDEAEAERALAALIGGKGLEAVAVCFLWSFRNAENERAVRDIVNRIAPDVFVTLSSEIAPVPGEYERSSTAAINAYAGKVARDYIVSLRELLVAHGFAGPLMVMQGYGGLLPSEAAAERSVGMIECGPAAGVIAAKALGGMMGDDQIIAADMGGTTFKVGVIRNGEFDYAREPMVDRYHYVAPKIEIVSIGAGGGSIVSLDPRTGIPRIGPTSAGADPGPVCYGRGGRDVTLTDVFTLIGYMDPDVFLGGAMKLDADAARDAFREQIADPLGKPVEEAAFGIFRVASAQVTDLIHEITVERGLDPRDHVLHAFGGSCPILSSSFGAELGVRRIVVPHMASVNCAFGLVAADVAHEYSVAATLPHDADPGAINGIYAPLVETARAQLAAEGFAEERTRLEWSIDLRYARQVHEVTTPVAGGTPMTRRGLARLIDDFEALYERKYGKGSAYREAGIEMTLFRLTARGLLDRPGIAEEPLGDRDAAHARIGRRPIFVDARDGMAPADIFDFEKLRPGNEIAGPAVIHTPITTIVVQDRQLARMDGLRNIVMDPG